MVPELRFVDAVGCARAKASVVMPCFFRFAKRDLAGRGCWARFAAGNVSEVECS